MSNLKTPIGRVSYPNLLKPKLNDMNPAAPKMEYSVDLLFDKNIDMSVFKNAASAAAKAKWGANPPKTARSPIKDGDEKLDKKGNPAPGYGGCYYVTLKTTRKPGVVDATTQPIFEESEIYGGCYGRASFSTYAYDKGGNKGVSFSLVNFQKVKEGESFGAAQVDAESDFDVIDGEMDNEANYAPATKKKSILG
jgi:hypothetical protein